TFYRAAFTNVSGTAYSYPAQLRYTEKLDTEGLVTVTGESYGPVQPNTSFTVSAPNAVVAGQPIVITGTGYLATDGATGSVANFMIDASYSGDPNTLNTTREIINPVTGGVFADKRSHGIVQASADGTWSIAIPWPDETNTTRDAAFFEANWAPGTQHIVRILTGSLLTSPADYQRGITVRFTVVEEPTIPSAVAPEVTTQPADVSVEAGQDATFSAAASGQPAPTVQWESSTDGTNWAPVAGATEATLTLSAVAVDRSGTQYRAVFTNEAGAATTNAATLIVTPAGPVYTEPTVTLPLEDATVEEGESAAFTFRLEGPAGWELELAQLRVWDEELSMWRSVPGANSATAQALPVEHTFVTAPLTLEDSGQYSARYRVKDADGVRYVGPGADAAGWFLLEPVTLTVVAPSTAVETPVLSNGEPAGTLITPKNVLIGESITISGTGFFLSDGSGGSGGPIFINQPSGGTGPVNVEGRTIENQIPGSTFSDPRAHGVFFSDEEGNWSITIPFPTPENSTLTEETAWKAGQTQSIRILTGSLVAGDKARSAVVEFTVVGEPPVITQQPLSPGFVLEGWSAQLSVAAENAESYQWQRQVAGDWVDLDPAQYPGADTDTLRFDPVLAEHFGFYRVVVTAPNGATVASDSVNLIRAASNVRVLTWPDDLTVDAGDDVALAVQAYFPERGTEPQLYVQEAADVWNPTELARVQLDVADLAERVASHTFVLEAVSAALDGAQLRVCAYMTEPGGGSGTCSPTFTLTVNDVEPSDVAPEVTTEPSDASVEAGQAASFTAAASGTPAPAVQWESSVDGIAWAPIVGATDATLTLSAVAVGQSGTQYRAVFTNTAGSATSDAATLTVTEPEPQDPNLNYTPVTSNTNGQPAGVLITPKEVVIGEPITISGTGWFLQNGNGGSAGPIFINQPSGGTGPVNVSGRTIENQIPGSTYADARAHGVFFSDADGNWSITIPFPTPENSTLTAETAWQAGQTQGIRILTGSLAAGDHSRNPFVEFTIVADEPEPADGISYDVSEPYFYGDTVHLTAAGYAEGDYVVFWVGAPGTPRAYAGVGWGFADADGVIETDVVLPAITQYGETFASGPYRIWDENWDSCCEVQVGPELMLGPDPSVAPPVLAAELPEYTDVDSNASIDFTVEADDAVEYRWVVERPDGSTEFRSGNATTVDFPVHNGPSGPIVTPVDGTIVTVAAWNAGGAVSSSTLVRLITEPLAAPVVTTHPAAVSVEAGQDATFTAAATGSLAPTVQWESSVDGTTWAPVVGATEATLTLTAVTSTQSGTQYRAVFTNSEGSETTEAATLTVTVPSSDAEIALTDTTVEQHGHVWFTLSNFDEGTSVRVELVNGGGQVIASAPFTIGADGNTADPDGQTYRRVTVPRDAAPGAYTARVVDAADDAVLATSESLTVTAATTRVFNPGDHDGGTEDLLVQRGGTWTFHAVGFAPNGTLTATAEIDGETVVLSGLGQISASEKAWQLDANGDTLREPVFTRVQIPASVLPGDFEVTFADGAIAVTRTLTIEAPATAEVTVAPSGELGGTIRVTGVGFTHPTEGGSRIAIKIDDGAYSRVDASTHANQTIWWIVDADEFGNFEIDMPLPNGTIADDAAAGTLGSTPALVPGEGYTLRLLTGSLNGGPSRTLQSDAFAVTAPGSVEEAPAITAQPADASVAAGAEAVFAAAASGTPTPAAQWESSTDGVAWVPITGATSATLTLPAVTEEQSGTRYRAVFANAAGTATTEAATLTVTAAPVEENPKPDFTPEAPVADGDDLPGELEGEVTVTQSGSTARVTVPGAEEGEWFFVYGYSTPTVLGWHQADGSGSFVVDLTPLGPGAHRLAVLDADGALVGWAVVTLAGSPTSALTGTGREATALPALALLVILAGAALALSARRHARR
ncbi:MAG: hypothetical protein AB7I24_14655, partial [Candidatus Nanopelagicales bacterium]